MKNSVKGLVVVTMLFFGCASQAQIFGVKGGLGLANISSPDIDIDNAFGRALGVKIGGTIEFDLTDELYVGSGLSFAKKGASTNGGNYNLYYLEIPAGARYNIVEIGNAGNLYVEAGFYLATPLGASIGGETLQLGEDVKRLDFGLNGGVGFIFDDRFQAGLLFEGGLTDVSGNENNILRNVALMASLGYKFGM